MMKLKLKLSRLFFPFIGLGALIWFLIRVIPKPSRAAYPCMRAAAPIASSFVIYVLGLLASVFAFKNARKWLLDSKYVLFSVALLAAVIFSSTSLLHTNKKAIASLQSTLEGPNLPIGEGKGVNPGRVVWIYNPDATDINCRNTTGDYWYQDDNTNQAVVNQMVSDALQKLTGETSDAAAWDAIFHYYNRTHGKGDVGYTVGEKIAIKINLNGLNNSFSARNINTSPQICYAVLDQLVHVVGVVQSDIGIGDPATSMDNVTYNKCHATFTNVKYWGNGNGRTPIVASSTPVLFASDNEFSDLLPQVYLDAAYMINLPVFKKHHRAGISLACKNHFGSIGVFTGGAWHLHPSLPCPEATGEVTNGDYGVYRCFVDIMGHKDLGGKTIVYLVDGIWGSTNWGHPPVKWRMPPFNNDWPSSIFMSQDPVALESVGFDFLYYEFDENHPTEGGDPNENTGPYPHFAGVDDYLHQAADSTNWPEGLIYDPEQDGTPLPASMGTHEHWNNAIDKKYTRNLGGDKGIELVSNLDGSGVDEGKSNLSSVVNDFALYQNYPNPFNPTTTIGYRLTNPSDITICLYNEKGEKIRTLVTGQRGAGFFEVQWDGLADSGMPMPSGIYYYQLTAMNNHQTFKQSNKMLLCK